MPIYTDRLVERNTFVSGTVGLRFKPRAGQVRHNTANGSSSLRHFFERSCKARVQRHGDGPRQRITRFRVLIYSE